jgi:ribonucleoside-diphosphate reductase beta chain
VLALSADDMRGRMREMQTLMPAAWHDVFDDGLRDIAKRIQAKPDDLALFVEGITTYHLIIEGVLAMTGQRFILDYQERHDIYPGFRNGFGLVERDEHRHIAFGVRFLKEAIGHDPSLGAVVERRVAELVPRAMLAFVPPSAKSADDWVYYENNSADIYGFAYEKLARRMKILGLEIPPAEELMPGPIRVAR